MIHEKWFISDTHFFHANMLKFVDDQGHRIRKFNSLDEMHETIAQNWNALVKDEDYVYHLGDVTFQYHQPFRQLMKRLKGKKRLHLGNHDRVHKQSPLLDVFEKIMLWHGFKEYNFTTTHMPMIKGTFRDGDFNVHGHTHEHILDDPHYINVCVETRNYTPVHLDTIIEEIKRVN